MLNLHELETLYENMLDRDPALEGVFDIQKHDVVTVVQ